MQQASALHAHPVPRSALRYPDNFAAAQEELAWSAAHKAGDTSQRISAHGGLVHFGLMAKCSQYSTPDLAQPKRPEPDVVLPEWIFSSNDNIDPDHIGSAHQHRSPAAAPLYDVDPAATGPLEVHVVHLLRAPEHQGLVGRLYDPDCGPSIDPDLAAMDLGSGCDQVFDGPTAGGATPHGDRR
jgi:hypothetical protein